VVKLTQLLFWDAARGWLLVGSLLLTFCDNASALEDGTDMLSQLIGNQLPTSKAQHSRRSSS
jgi:hypothetical protein